MSSLRREHRGGSRELERYNADSYPTSSGSSDVSTSMVQRQQTQFQAQLDRLANQNAWLLRRMQGLEQQVAVDRARIIDQQDQIQYLATESSLVRGGGQGHASDRSSHASSLELVAAAGMHRSSAGSLASYAIVNNGSGHGSGTPGHHPAHGMSAVAMGSSGTGGASATWSDRYPSSSTPSWRARPLQIEHHLQHHGPQAPSPNTAAAAARRPAAPQGGAAEFAGWSMRGDQYPPMQDGWSQQPPAFAPMPMRGELGMDSGDPDMMYGIMHLDQHQRPDQYDHVPLGSGPRAPSSATAAYSMTTRATQQSSYEALGPADMWGAAPTMSGGGDPRGGMPRMYDAPMDPYYVDPSARQMRRPRSNLSGGGGDAERPPSKRMRTSSSQQHADPMLQSG
ncbi:hypothetical protein BC828DRAFT_372764 [Blastocladiella britannica]|nr:hypothetical protein BC828DRAFT_372764 [Blastocladiella britannica]